MHWTEQPEILILTELYFLSGSSFCCCLNCYYIDASALFIHVTLLSFMSSICLCLFGLTETIFYNLTMSQSKTKNFFILAVYNPKFLDRHLHLSRIAFWAKRYDVKEWAMHVVYWVNQKFKDRNSIDTLPYTYPCKTICISADGCILWEALIWFYGSPRLLYSVHAVSEYKKRSYKIR